MALGKRKPTDVAVRDYINAYGTKKYGLQDKDIGWYNDPGVEGSNVRVSLGGKPVAEPSYLSNDNRTYMDEEKLRSAIDSYAQDQGLRDLTVGYQSPYKDQTDNLLKEITEAEEFNFDPETNPLYQSRKNMYMRNADRAFEDTMGDIASSKSGRVDSWAIAAASQAKDRYLGELDDELPELYQLAYNMHLNEQNNDMNKLNLISNLDNKEYGRYRDDINDFNTNRDFDYTVDRAARADMESDRTFHHQVSREKILDDQWMKQFDETTRRALVNEALQKRQISTSEANAALSRERFNWEKDPTNPDNIYKQKQIEKMDLLSSEDPENAITLKDIKSRLDNIDKDTELDSSTKQKMAIDSILDNADLLTNEQINQLLKYYELPTGDKAFEIYSQEPTETKKSNWWDKFNIFN